MCTLRSGRVRMRCWSTIRSEASTGSASARSKPPTRTPKKRSFSPSGLRRGGGRGQHQEDQPRVELRVRAVEIVDRVDQLVVFDEDAVAARQPGIVEDQHVRLLVADHGYVVGD